MRRNVATFMALAMAFAIAATGCATETDAEDTVLPVAIVDDQGDEILAGAYDPATSEVYLVSALQDAIVDSMAERGIELSALSVRGASWESALNLSNDGVAIGDRLSSGDVLLITAPAPGTGAPIVLGEMRIMSAQWSDSLTEAEAASRFPACI